MEYTIPEKGTPEYDRLIEVLTKAINNCDSPWLLFVTSLFGCNYFNSFNFKNLFNMTTVKVVNKSNNPLPKFETSKAAGMDLRASFKYVTPTTPLKVFGDAEIIFSGEGHSKTMLRLEPGARAIIPTDLYITVPDGHFCAIYPRSGLSIKKGLGLCNSVGVLDADYTGNMGIPVTNNGFETIWIEDGERIAQMIIQPYVKFEWEEVDSLEKTDRNAEGFGTTGTK